MKLSVLLSVLMAVAVSALPAKDFAARQYFALEIDAQTLPKVVSDFPFRYEHPARGLADHHVFSLEKSHDLSALLGNLNSDPESLMKRGDLHDDLLRHDVKSVHLLPPKRLHRRAPIRMVSGKGDECEPDADSNGKSILKRDSPDFLDQTAKSLAINDPLFEKQWHLVNRAFPGKDLNVTGVWIEKNITGRGVVTALVDDGLDFTSKDLEHRFSLEGSWDFNNPGPKPAPRLADDWHGTRCAAEIAGERGNDYCGVGVAYGSKVSGVRILSGTITQEDEAASLVHALDVNDIYSCSWGPPDNGVAMQAPQALVKKAMSRGVTDGRHKKGAVYVFASGNGASSGDNCNFDGYTNSIYSITVGAIDHKDQHPYYSESCSAVLVVTYSSGDNEHIVTSDIHNKCCNTHGGTSASAPLAAGVYALVLEANPALTWRDVQYLTIMSLVEPNEDGAWQMAGMGRRYSHKYGYGKLDAYRIVDMAQGWKNVNEQVLVEHKTRDIQAEIPDDKHAVTDTLKVTEKDVKGVKNLEHVTVTVNIDAGIRGQVAVTLTSPRGVKSELGVFRDHDKDRTGFKDWTFMSVAHWGESGVGEWKLEVLKREDQKGVNKVVLKDWQMNMYGQKTSESETEKEKEKEKETGTSQTLSSQTSLQASLTLSSQTSLQTSQTLSSQISLSSSSTLPEEEDGVNRNTSSSNMVTYLAALVLIGFVAALYFLSASKKRNTRRRRREEIEFDLYSSNDEDAEDLTDFEIHDEEVDLGDDRVPPPVPPKDYVDGVIFSSDEEAAVGETKNLVDHNESVRDLMDDDSEMYRINDIRQVKGTSGGVGTGEEASPNKLRCAEN
ncbi:hypothetical protein BABINDRAFT_180966 [Babjeviella inositovora NRRL Y-12698]|uniref:P/Homo B domain-containing protein n=1 Tax=Babjeviella inositovora NRRL Y-12698 TaxID=984486 RepID=A0A1E3QM22_9ASCO|nr:uncharacterized protein BABINDRAFT_180966 [Babjeviella inositovora NRRL Y-12698]ODQ78749.1 hypothetical protein BABINDRAFT_180966 [Babjeviella inositovora NRRL Y-12698]